MPIETVLLAVSSKDDSRVERITDVAIEVAEPLGATVVVAHVLPEGDDGVSTNVTPLIGGSPPYVLSEDDYDDLLDEYPLEEYAVDDVVAHQSTLADAADRLDAAGVDYEIRGAVGEPADGLNELATELDADRVVVSGRNRSPTDKVIFGSVAQKVLLDAPCPVTFVRDD